MSAFEKTFQGFHQGVLQRPRPAADYERAPAPRPTSNLPAALAFLSAYGVPPSVLLQASFLGVVEGVRPEAAMTAHGLITEDEYYRALARHLGVPFVESEPNLSSLASFPQSIVAGFVAMNEPGERIWLLAPQGHQIDLWLAARRRGAVGADFALTSPGRLRSLVTHHCREGAVARACAVPVPACGEGLSAMLWTPARIAPWLACAAALTGALWLAGGLLALLGACLLSLVLAAFTSLRLLALAASCDGEPWPGRVALTPKELPIYTVIVALYREAAVAPQLVAALDALDYPRSRLDIKLVIEQSDEATRRALEDLALPARYEIVVAPEGRPRTKPRALNLALELARGSLTCVFDAEDIPEPRQLREAAERFAALPDHVACLQGRLAIDNGADGWLARCFALEYAALFDVMNPGLAALGIPIPLGGTSNHFRTQALRRAGGWDAWNVTEDIDLGFRLARFGFMTATLKAATFEEAPVALGAWLRQRRRWFKGWLQTALVHFSRPLDAAAAMGLRNALGAFLLVIGTMTGALLGPLFALAFAVELLRGWTMPPGVGGVLASALWCFVFASGLASAIWPVWLGARRRGLRLAAMASLPLYWTLMSVAAWWSVFDLLRDPFHWLKTEHGLARRRNLPI